MTYYLKYRGQKFDDLDLTSVRQSLLQIVKSGNIPHAFLFSGPKGSGKTSAARILAKSLNCESRSKHLRGRKLEEPCNKCKVCLSISGGSNIDVVEIDAASHRGIDDIRALRDAVKLATAGSKNKIYIIDEAHMLTTEASNALLKTLEEPPNHVYFVLATTNPEKLIETIRSRATNITFKKANNDELKRAILRVAKGEKLTIDNGSIDLIANASDGSFRDAVKMLEQLVSEKVKLTEEKVSERIIKHNIVNADEFIDFLIEKDSQELLQMIEKLTEAGAGVDMFLSNVIAKLRSLLVSRIMENGAGSFELEIDNQRLIKLIELLNGAYDNIGASPIEQLPLEIAVIKWCEQNIAKGISRLSIDDYAGKDKRRLMPKKKFKSSLVSTSVKSTPSDKTVGIKSDKITDEVWRRILTEVRPRNAATEALLRAATPIGFDGKSLTIGVFYSFHKERLEEHFHRSLLEEVSGAVLGSKVKIVCTLTPSPERTEVRKVPIESNQGNDKSDDAGDLALTDSDEADIMKIAKEVFGN